MGHWQRVLRQVIGTEGTQVQWESTYRKVRGPRCAESRYVSSGGKYCYVLCGRVDQFLWLYRLCGITLQRQLPTYTSSELQAWGGSFYSTINGQLGLLSKTAFKLRCQGRFCISAPERRYTTSVNITGTMRSHGCSSDIYSTSIRLGQYHMEINYNETEDKLEGNCRLRGISHIRDRIYAFMAE